MTPEDRVRQLIGRARDEAGPSAGEWEAFMDRAHRRLFVSRAVAAGAALLLVVGGVAAGALLLRDNPTVPAPLPPAASETPSPGTSESPPPDAHTEIPVELWYAQGEVLYRDVQVVEARVDESNDTTWGGSDIEAAGAAVSALLDPQRRPTGVTSAIPAQTKEATVSIYGEGSVIVDLSSEFESGGGSLSMQMRVAQVVFTLTQFFPEISSVLFEIDGEPRDSIGGEGIDTSHPLGRRDFDDLAPLIMVDTPAIGQEISTPVTVSGTANTFEANVVIRVLDESGDVLIETFTTATCGTGCRGDYTENVEFTVDHRQPGTVEVLEYSAKDGSPQNVVSIPVTLVP